MNMFLFNLTLTLEIGILLIHRVRLFALSRNMMIIRVAQIISYALPHLCSAFLFTVELLLPKLVPGSTSLYLEENMDLLSYIRQ